MLKRLLIAVLALSFIFAFTGTAFSDVYPDGDVGGKAIVRYDANNQKASQAELIHPLQSTSRPIGDRLQPLTQTSLTTVPQSASELFVPLLLVWEDLR